MYAILFAHVAIAMGDTHGHVVAPWTDRQDTFGFFGMILQPVLLHMFQFRLGHLPGKPSRRTVDGLHPEKLLVVCLREGLGTMNGKLKDCLVERSNQDAIFELGLSQFLGGARGIVFNLQESVMSLLLSDARLLSASPGNLVLCILQGMLFSHTHSRQELRLRELLGGARGIVFNLELSTLPLHWMCSNKFYAGQDLHLLRNLTVWLFK